ncbi:MAG: sulfide/dihydroorotate dehydrogenase-like FAD/NAD-binding protein [Actinomycetota bacterium]|nr:sulfide/dihydroorotate dehydrogenase-like FAD/NAD-binding protein [Actinomycetota bacterium]
MANRILEKKTFRSDLFFFVVDAPEIAKKAQAGQFVIIRVDEIGERIPLSLADINPEKGTISLIVMTVGVTSTKLSKLNVGDEISDIAGPMGHKTPIENYGRVILVGGGFGAAPLYPIARAMKQAGNTVISIIGARTADLLIYEKELGEFSDQVLVSTDDGSKGVKGLVTDVLKADIEANGADLVMAVGPAIMMKFVSLTTKPYNVKTLVSLNPIMVDGTGMCGACRVSVGGKTMFGCTDGPDFDGHLVDWELLMSRQRTYLPEEKAAMERYLCSCAEDASAVGSR